VGCRPCTSSRLPTKSSAASRSASTRSSIAAMILVSPAPYSSITSRTNSSARACAAGPSAAQAPISDWIRSPAERQCESATSSAPTGSLAGQGLGG
jgi:hypothetical protein